MRYADHEIVYNLNKTDKTATVKTNTLTTGSQVSIPAVLFVSGEKYTVNKIGKRAFKDCQKLFSITLPTSIKVVGVEAFYGCKHLQWVSAGNIRIEKLAFTECIRMSHFSAHSVILNGCSVFYNCNNLLTFSKHTVFEQKIPELSFYGCKKLEKIRIAAETDVEEAAFHGLSHTISLIFMGNAQIVDNSGGYAKSIRDRAIIKCQSTSNLINLAFDGWNVQIFEDGENT